MQVVMPTVTCYNRKHPPLDDLGAALPALLTGGSPLASSGLAPASPMPTIAAAATPPAAKYDVGKPPPAAHQKLLLCTLEDAGGQST